MKKIFYILILILNLNSLLYSQNTLQNYHTAIILYNNKEYSEAIKKLNTVISEVPQNINALIIRGKCYIELNELTSAITDFEAADKIKKDIGTYYLAQTYALNGNAEKAVQYLEEHLSSRYKRSEHEIRLDSKFKNIENSELWINLWKNEWYTKKEHNIEEIKYLYNSAEYLDALDMADEQIKKYKKSHELYALRAQIYHKLNNDKAALVNYNKAININKRTTEYYIKRGESLLNLDKSNQALSDFDKALKLSDDHIELYLYKARVLNELGKYSLATDQVINYLDLVPGDPKAVLLCGEIFHNNEKYDEAVLYFTKLINKDQSKPEYYLHRANSLYEDKNYHKAYEDYSMALDLEPNNPLIYLYRGNARLRMGQYSGACSDWQKADQMGSLEAKKNIMQFCK